MARPHDSGLDFRADHDLLTSHARGDSSPAPWLAALLIGAVAAAVWYVREQPGAAPSDGTIRIESDPTGAAIEVDGSLRGLTPLTLTLAPGQYAITVAHEGYRRTIAAAVDAGTERVHHVSLPRSPEGPHLTGGRLQVTSDPPGATVTVDGVARGLTPISIEDLEPGEHEVITRHVGVSERRIVTVEAGATASLAITPGLDARSGWLVVRSPTPLQIYESGRFVGTTEDERIALTAGTYTVELRADELGFRSRRTVTITAGQTTSAPVALPMAAVSVNAVPWAQVWIDDKPAGETPIANLLQPIGTHRVRLRHPQYGERHATVTVSLKEPARVAVDMRVQ